MTASGIRSAADIDAFFEAYNERDYDGIFRRFMADDCLWHAAEKPLRGRQAILNYWTTTHAAFTEHLGKAENAIFRNDRAYVQVKIRLDFVKDGSFYGRSYKKGDICHFGCVDYYEFDANARIRLGLIYVKFFD